MNKLYLFLIIYFLASFYGYSYESLSGDEIKHTIEIYDLYTEIFEKAIRSESKKDKVKKDFNQVFPKINQLIVESEKKASQEKNMPYDAYRNNFKRILAVKYYVMYSEVKAQLEKEIMQKQNLTDEELAAQAEKSYQDTLDWFNNLDDKRKPFYEEVVVQPIKKQKENNTLVKNFKEANVKKNKEHKKSLLKIEEYLSREQMKQAAIDAVEVLNTIGKEKLDSLSSTGSNDVYKLKDF